MSKVQGRVFTDDHTRSFHVTETDAGGLEVLADANDNDVLLTLDLCAARNLRLLLTAYERRHKDDPNPEVRRP